jgi:hypothetical protein
MAASKVNRPGFCRLHPPQIVQDAPSDQDGHDAWRRGVSIAARTIGSSRSCAAMVPS